MPDELTKRQSLLDSDTEALKILEYAAEVCDLPFDIERAAQLYRAAVQKIEPTLPRAARLRLAQAAEGLGMRLQPHYLSIREALGHIHKEETPLLIFTITSSGTGRWFIVQESDGRRGLVQTPDQEEPVSYSAEELARLFGACDADVVLEWLEPLPIATPPLSTATSPFNEHHPFHSSIHPWKRLLQLLRPDSTDIRLVIYFAIAIGLFNLTVPIVTMAVVNTVAFGTLIQQLIILCLALLVALVIAGVLLLLQYVLVEYIQRRIFVRVASELSYRLPRVDLKAFDQRYGPELVNRFFDVLTVQKSSAVLLLDGISLLLQMAIGMILLAFYHPLLLGFDLVLTGALVVWALVLGRGAVRTAIRESIAKYRVAGWMEEVARHPVAFKLSGGPRMAWDRAEALTREYLDARKQHFVILVRQFVFMIFLYVVVNVALLALGGTLVIQGQLTLGELVATEIIVNLILATFLKIIKYVEAYYDILAAMDKLGQLLDLPLESQLGEHHVSYSKGASVTLHTVTFAYSGQKWPALHQLSLSIAPGERVAIVGPNGAGKSTLADVLYGLRIPQSGWVEIDGIDIRSLRLDSLREHVALVKGVEIIEGTLLDNLRMGRNEISLLQIHDMLRKVGMLETVMAFPDGLQTMLWGDGKPLSVGQASRLMLARAMLGHPRLLIIDESLDHIDEQFRDTILASLLDPSAPWTLILITHSPDVARQCDRVITLQPPARSGARDVKSLAG
ncbi:MAG: ATP-binding cassette domain-containing protein [Gemmataceae bacterium]|nr:ATP-binding cassette domain-containing protein [Gemmataceae bacterium]MDW8242398.1 ATP-binding cassette domain-containing protein [Thermogemmata sp.]